MSAANFTILYFKTQSTRSLSYADDTLMTYLKNFAYVMLRVSNRPDFGETFRILTENTKSRLDFSRDTKCPGFEKQRSFRAKK